MLPSGLLWLDKRFRVELMNNLWSDLAISMVIFVVFNHREFFLNDFSLTHCLAKEELAEKVIPDSVN